MHGCFNASISEDIDFEIFDEINRMAAAILDDRESKIAAMEKSLIDRFIRKRNQLTDVSLKEGCSYANQYEVQYRQAIEDFIKNLEIEISKHLDYLQQEIEADKKLIFQEVDTNIIRITKEADQARINFYQLLQIVVVRKRQEIMQMIHHIHQDIQPLGYEQLRKVEVDIYSTTGMKTNDNCCVEIRDRAKFIKDIKEAKPHQPAVKRTVYLQSSFATQQTTNRTNH
jgi:hypothetical protein